MYDYEMIEERFSSLCCGMFNEDEKKYSLWREIKSNKLLLNWAISVTKDDNGKTIVNGLAICNAILCDYNNIDSNIYNKLVKLIFSNVDVARLVFSDSDGIESSFLVSTLMNHNLKLSESEKDFAVKEALYRYDAELCDDFTAKYSYILEKLEESGIPIEKLDLGKEELFKQKFIINEALNIRGSYCHGKKSHFDIRYYILTNPNWSIEEKKNLINRFWVHDDIFLKYVNTWEKGIIEDAAYYSESDFSPIDIDELYLYTRSELEDYFDKEDANTLYDEIKFCKQMKKIREENR